MKKLMFAAATVAALVGMSDIESENIVGYQTQSWMNKGTYYMMGMQFETTAGASIKLNDIDFGGMTGPYFDDDGAFVATAPQVQLAFANSEGTTSYYYLADGNETMDGPGWTDNGGNPANPDVSVALGFWYRNTTSTAPSFTTAGQVVPDSPWEKDLDAHFRMLVSPFPTATTLADINFGKIAETAPYYDDDGNFVATATQIQVPFVSSEGFTTYFYLADGNETMDGPGWTDNGGNPVDASSIIIPAGRGCWFKGNAPLTVTFTK